MIYCPEIGGHHKSKAFAGELQTRISTPQLVTPLLLLGEAQREYLAPSGCPGLQGAWTQQSLSGLGASVSTAVVS